MALHKVLRDPLTSADGQLRRHYLLLSLSRGMIYCKRCGAVNAVVISLA